ncbi:MAG: MBL fold metallo-hydrolase [Deltaproteobacteria bacterium]
MMKFCSLYSGSSGNSIYVESSNSKILIDAGVSGKKIEQGLASIGTCANEIDAILVTHEHSDHVSSIGLLSKKYDIPVYATNLTWNQLDEQSVKMKPSNRMTFEIDNWFSIGDLDIMPFKIPHDAIEPCGFSIFGEGKKVTIATDIGHINNYLSENMEKSNMLLLESNHDIEMLRAGRYPWFLKRRILSENGHLCNEDAARTIVNLVESGMKNFLLGHLSTENNFPELALQTVTNSLEEIGIKIGRDICLEVAPRYAPSTVITL